MTWQITKNPYDGFVPYVASAPNIAFRTRVVVLREDDGYSDQFNADRYVYKDYGEGWTITYHDKVGANCKSAAFADDNDGMTLPDGQYYYTTEGLTKQDDGTFDSGSYANVLRMQTSDPNIPETVRDAINNDFFLDHANQFKTSTTPYNSNKTPGSAGCTIGSGGQEKQDAYMEAVMEGVTDISTIEKVIHSYSNGVI